MLIRRSNSQVKPKWSDLRRHIKQAVSLIGINEHHTLVNNFHVLLIMRRFLFVRLTTFGLAAAPAFTNAAIGPPN
eukprot:SAG22_NODE_195_length_15606_cov_21.340878_2_plen_75_part_00